MHKWKVKMSKIAEVEFKKLLKEKILNLDDIAVIKAWVTEMEEEGPEYIKKSKRWADHPLHTEWEGYRASCFSNPGRIIYKIAGNEIIIEVHRVTHNHNYKK
jgi:mRNA-degrading endonuclease YafQ of YafQ-DinJ toxin-antitoxin module